MKFSHLASIGMIITATILLYNASMQNIEVFKIITKFEMKLESIHLVKTSSGNLLKVNFIIYNPSELDLTDVGYVGKATLNGEYIGSIHPTERLIFHPDGREIFTFEVKIDEFRSPIIENAVRNNEWDWNFESWIYIKLHGKTYRLYFVNKAQVKPVWEHVSKPTWEHV